MKIIQCILGMFIYMNAIGFYVAANRDDHLCGNDFGYERWKEAPPLIKPMYPGLYLGIKITEGKHCEEK